MSPPQKQLVFDNDDKATLIKLCVLLQNLTEKVEENSESVKEIISDLRQALNYMQETHVIPLTVRVADKESRLDRLEKIVYGCVMSIVLSIVSGVVALVKWKA